MPTFDFPVNRGRFITEFFEAFDRERRLRSEMATAEQLRQVREMELARGRRQAEDELATRSLVPRLFAGAPREGAARVSALPSVAGGGAPLTPEQAGIESFAVRPPLPGVAGAEDVLRAHTLRSVTEALGGSENLAAMLRTAEGRQAIQAVAPITDEEFDRLQKRRQGWLEAQQHTERARQLYEAGDTVGGRGAEAAAYRALYSAADPTKDDVGKYLDKIKQANEDIVKARKEGPELEEETKRLAPLRSDVFRHPDDPDVLARYAEGASGAKTGYWQKQADRDVPKIMELLVRGAEKGKVDRAYAAVMGEFLKARSQGREAMGEPLTNEAAARLALERQPQHAEGFLRAMRESKGDIADLWSRAFWGLPKVPKNEFDVADQQAADEARKDPTKPAPGQPGYAARMGEILRDLRNRQTPDQAELARLRKETAALKLQAMKEPEKISDEKLSLMIDRAGRDVKRAEELGSEEELQGAKDDLRFFRELRAKRTAAQGRTVTPPAAEGTFDTLPPAAQYKGRVMRDTTSGKRFRSDGVTWTEIK